MFQKMSQVQLLSENPLWINDNGNCTLIPNVYNNMNVVRVFHGKKYQDYKIGPNMTIIPSEGLVFYRTQEEAVRYQTLLNSKNGQEQQLVLNESFIQSRNVCKNEIKAEIEPGLYSFSAFDSVIVHNDLLELRYLNRENLIKKIHPAEGELFDYIMNSNEKMPTNPDNMPKCRIIYEVAKGHTEGTSIVEMFLINDEKSHSDGFVRFSMLNGYPIFVSKESAAIYRKNMSCNKTPFQLTVGKTNDRKLKAQQAQIKDQELRNNIISGVQFLGNNLGNIYQYGTMAFKKIKEFKDSRNKTPGII